MKQILAGTTDYTLYVKILDSSKTDGSGLAGLAFNTSGLTASYVRNRGARTAISLVTQTVTGAHSDGGFVEIDSTNCKGLYRLDLPDAAIAASADKCIIYLYGAANMAETALEIELVAYNPQDSNALGLGYITAAVATASALSTVSTNVSTVLSRIGAFTGSGVNTVLGFFQALFRSDASTPSDIGGTFDPSTESTQALRDHIGNGTNLTEAGGTGDHLSAVPDTSGTTTLLSRLSATRAGYLDNLSAGAVATAAKLLAFFQLAFRSDAAIKTDNAAELTEINANEGSGAGDFDNETEALEAIVDTGNAAWTTGSGTGLTALATGTAQAGAAGTITLAAGASATDDLFNGQVVKITSGTGAGQARLVTDYVGATKVASVSPNWATNPDATSVYEIVEGPADVRLIEGADPTNTIRDSIVDDATLIDASALNTASTAVGSDGSGLTEAGGTGDHLTGVPDTSGTTTLLSRLSAARAGYLDNLSAGAVATASALSTVATNVSTLLTRIPAALFSGITSLGNWLRLLARKDSALATDAATELAEINDDLGSGAGAYANTTDAQEAIRDNQGGGGGGSDVYEIKGSYMVTGTTFNYEFWLEKNGQPIGTVSNPTIDILDKDGVSISFSSTPTIVGTDIAKGSGTWSPTNNVPYVVEVTLDYSAVTYTGRLPAGATAA